VVDVSSARTVLGLLSAISFGVYRRAVANFLGDARVADALGLVWSLAFVFFCLLLIALWFARVR